MCKIVIVLLLLPSVCVAGWDSEDTAYQCSWAVVGVIDYLQTDAFLSEGAEEANVVVRQNPEYLTEIAIIYAVLHTTIAYLLPKKWRNRFQLLTIGMHTQAVVHNYQVGVRISL